MDINSLKARFVSFGYSLLAVAVTATLGYFSSSQFATLVTQHFGPGVGTTLFFMALTEVIKYARNHFVIAQAKLGAVNGQSKEFFLI